MVTLHPTPTNVIPAPLGPEGDEREQAGNHAAHRTLSFTTLPARGPSGGSKSPLSDAWVPACSRLLASLTSGAGMT
jgi:hypothetical protein